MEQKVTYGKLYTDDQILLYEGNLLNGKPFGEGTVYYPDGKKYKEGTFDVKGLVKGKEYYSNGNIRFEGTYEINHGYGPNYPISGKCYNESGELIFEGKLHITKSGLGWPNVLEPEGYGAIVGEGKPEITYLMWEDLNN